MAVEVVESAPDSYGNDIRVGDTVVCLNNGIKKAIVEQILRRTSTSRRIGRVTVRDELIVREWINRERISPHTSKQKDARSVVKI